MYSVDVLRSIIHACSGRGGLRDSRSVLWLGNVWHPCACSEVSFERSRGLLCLQTAVWCGLMQRSNRKPLPTVNRKRILPHAVAVIVAPLHHLARWRSVLRRWAPALHTATLEDCGSSQPVRAEVEAFAARLESVDPAGATPPCDVLLVSTATAVSEDTVDLLQRVPWLLAITEGCGSIPRAQFRVWRRVLTGAHQRIALECDGPDAMDSQLLRNLLEVVQPQLMDCRQGNMLTLATCASPAAEQVCRAPMLCGRDVCALNTHVGPNMSSWAAHLISRHVLAFLGSLRDVSLLKQRTSRSVSTHATRWQLVCIVAGLRLLALDFVFVTDARVRHGLLVCTFGAGSMSVPDWRQCMQHEGKRMREALAPYLLQLTADAVVHQWAPKQYVQRSSCMPEAHARVYREHAAQHAQQLFEARPVPSCCSAAVPKCAPSSLCASLPVPPPSCTSGCVSP